MHSSQVYLPVRINKQILFVRPLKEFIKRPSRGLIKDTLSPDVAKRIDVRNL